jgi:hypothetical protein
MVIFYFICFFISRGVKVKCRLQVNCLLEKPLTSDCTEYISLSYAIGTVVGS